MAKISVRYVVSGKCSSDGRYPIKLYFTYKRRNTLLATGLYAREEDLTASSRGASTREKWEEMKHSGNFDYHHSPCARSISEYLVNLETGDIYLYSDHWGFGIRDCNWYLEKCGEFCNGVAIGCANISEFKSNILIEAIFYNSAEIEELSFAIDKDIKQLERMKDLYTCEDGVLKLTENEISRLRKKKKELLADYNLYNQDPRAFFESKIAR